MHGSRPTTLGTGAVSRLVALVALVVAACAPTPPPPPTPTSPPRSPTAAPAPPTPTAAKPAPTSPLAAAGVTHLRVSHPDGGGHLPLFYAKDMRIFDKHGLDVELQPLGGGPPSVAALLSGQTQIADTTGTELANAIAGGAESVIMIGTLVPVYPYVFEVSSDVTVPADLKGRKIAVRAFGDATDIATRITLKKLGLDPDDDVQILTLEQAGARMAALQTSQICCTMAQPQDRLLLEKQGFHSLFDLAAERLVNSQGVLALQKPFADANHNVVQQFADSVVESITAIKKDRVNAVTILKKYLQVEDDNLAQVTYDFFVGEVIPAVPVPRADQFAAGISVLADKNPRLAGFDVSKYLDASYIENAQAHGLAGP